LFPYLYSSNKAFFIGQISMVVDFTGFFLEVVVHLNIILSLFIDTSKIQKLYPIVMPLDNFSGFMMFISIITTRETKFSEQNMLPA
jgi:hypothetical protein